MEQTSAQIVGIGWRAIPPRFAMASALRAAVSAGVCLLAACSVAPPSQLEMVQVDAKKITLGHSSFSAQVVANDVSSVTHTFTASLDPRMMSTTRLESTYTQVFDPEGRERLRVGDAVSSVGMWGSAVRFGGMQFGTREGGRVDVVNSSELATSGLAVLPTVEDALFASLKSNHAPLAARKLSSSHSTTAFNGKSMGLQLQDALGRSLSIDAPVIDRVRIVQEGCQDFSIGFGKVRRDYAIESNEYGPLFANSTVACGTPLGFTVEGHTEYLQDEVAAFGVGIARDFGAIGAASFAIAQSRTELGYGWLARAGFEHRNPWFNLALRTRMQSREFREINSLELEVPVMQRDIATLGINLSESTSLSLAYATQVTWARERADLFALRQSLSLGSGSLSLSAGHSMTDNIGSSLFISYQRPFGVSRRQRSPIEEFDVEMLTRSLGQ
jgi:outer membrane usher protein FimD/PapC